MDPNQQPNQSPPVEPAPQPQVPPQPAEQPQPFAPQPAQPFVEPQASAPVNPYAPQPSYSAPAAAPTLTAAYNTPPPESYDPNYLDSIAAAPPKAAFFSGNFGKIFFVMIGVFVLAVSLIVAFSGKDKTADLQQTTVRVTNFVLLTKTEQPYIQSSKLSNNNTAFGLILTDAETKGAALLSQAGVMKSQYSKTMVKSETKLNTNLTNQFENSRLNGNLDTDYARTMAAETSKLISLFTTMSKQSKAKAIRDYAKGVETNLTPIQKIFDGFVDDGN